MTKTKNAAVVLDERTTDGTSAGRRGKEAEIALSTSLMFMDAANNINVQDFTVDNVRNYTLQKFNVDVTKNIFKSWKPTTRAEIRAERKRIDASKQAGVNNSQNDKTKTKRKFVTILGSPIGKTKKKDVGHEKTIQPLVEGQESLILQEEANDNAKNPEDERKMAKTTEGSFNQNDKNAIISSKKLKSKAQTGSRKKKSIGSVKVTPASPKKEESQVLENQVAENDGNAENETNLAKVGKLKTKRKSKRDV